MLKIAPGCRLPITVADIYASLIGFVETISEDFDEIEEQAKELTGTDNYTDDVKRSSSSTHRR